jgi:two-component system, OmpR family, response regulator
MELAVRILLVEDNLLIGNALRDHVAAECWKVDWATTLGQAKAAVGLTHYSVILLDLRLPDGSGLELLRQLRDKAEMVPVIILSAYDQISDQIEGLRIGAVDYLVKPFNLRELITRIRRIALTAAEVRRDHLFATHALPEANLRQE